MLFFGERLQSEIIEDEQWHDNHGFQAPELLDPAYYLDTIPVSIDFGQIALIAALSLALSLVVSLIPARKASRISVQELIRKS